MPPDDGLLAQVQRLVRVEQELCELQADLDLRARLHRELNDAGRAFALADRPEDVRRLAVRHALYSLDFERAVLVVPDGARARWRPAAWDGYHDEAARAAVAAAVLERGEPGLAPLLAGEATAWGSSHDGALAPVGRALGLDELALLPLAAGPGRVPELLAVGVRSERRAFHPLPRPGSAPFEALGSLASLATSALFACEARRQEVLRREAVVRLAGGLAHDVDNLLAVIRVSAEGARPDDLGVILASCDRGAAFVSRLLAVAACQPVEPRLVELDATLRDLCPSLERLLGPSRPLEVEPAAGRACVRMDPVQLEQVVLNLTANARDAMPDGGTLRLATARAPLAPAEAERLGLAPGDYLLLTVRDTGLGLTEDVKARAFEPFFTTKGTGRGTGLGLPTVYGIVRQCAGAVELESAPGEGATVRAWFPLAADAAPAPASTHAPEPASAPPPAPGQPCLLLAEDEDLLRGGLARFLRGQGYRVHEAADGEGALAAAADLQGPLDLLITDVTMPRLDGPELARRLAAYRPGLRVLFITGSIDEATASTLGAPALRKPFTLARLGEAVRGLLESAP